jgi:hypothetical protein
MRVAEQRGARYRAERKYFTMRSLWRLALWGTSAAAALAVAVLVSTTEVGSQRVHVAMATIADATNGRLAAARPEQAKQPTAAQVAAQLAARSAEAERDTRRLTDAIQRLGADRDRLLARIALLEHNLDDVTGSIKQQIELARQAPAQPPAPTVTAAIPPRPATPPEQSLPPAAAAATPPATVPAHAPPAAPPVATEAPPAQPAPVITEAPHTEPVVKVEYGVDLGGAPSFDGLRARWNSARNNQPALLESLHPIIAVRENPKTRAVEMRLVAGPLNNAAAAARICAAFAKAGRFCQPAIYDGQRLALR